MTDESTGTKRAKTGSPTPDPELVALVRAAYRSGRYASMGELAASLGTTRWRLRARLDPQVREEVSRYLALNVRSGSRARITPEHAASAIARVAAAHQSATLSQSAYTRARRGDEPSTAWITATLGWANACRAAGVAPARPSAPSRYRGSSDEQLLTRVAPFFAAHPQGRSGEYRAWHAEHPESPSWHTLRSRLSPWPALAARAREHLAGANHL